MESVTIYSKTDVVAKSTNPKFKYKFKQGIAKKIPKHHADKLFKNSNFYKNLNTPKTTKKKEEDGNTTQ